MREIAVKVWDAPVRLFHWGLFLAFAFLIVSGKVGGNLMEYHVYAGYTVLALVLFRVVWGFVGGTHARFASFLAGPGGAIAYARKLLSGAAPSAGHNPLGGWMVIVLLLALLFQGVTGLCSNDDIAFEGPLYQYVSKALSDRLTSLHRLNSDLLLALVAVHVAAVAFHALVKKENLVGAMFTGVKRLPEGTEGTQSIRFASPWLAVAILAVSAAVVFLVVKRPF